MEIKGKIIVKHTNGTTVAQKGKLILPDANNIRSIEGSGKINFKNIKVDTFSYKGKIYCNSIVAKKGVSMYGAITAKKIEAGPLCSVVFSNNISVEEIIASKVEIAPVEESKRNALPRLLAMFFHVRIEKQEEIHADFKSINATEVTLTDCDADVIVCDKIQLSGKCNIKKLVCSGDVKIVGNDVKIHSQEKK